MADPFPGRVSRRPAVLVVDGNPAVCQTLAACLRAEGFSAWLAASGPDAVELLRVCGEVDLVLLEADLRGWDGPRTLAALREIDPGLPCCFLGDPPRALPAPGASWVFRKPFHGAAVARALRQLLGGAWGRRSEGPPRPAGFASTHEPPLLSRLVVGDAVPGEGSAPGAVLEEGDPVAPLVEEA